MYDDVCSAVIGKEEGRRRHCCTFWLSAIIRVIWR